MKTKLLLSILALSMLIATPLTSAEIIPVWHKVNESGDIHDMEFLRGEDQFIMITGEGDKGEIQTRDTQTGTIVSSFPLHTLWQLDQLEITPDSNRFVITTGGDKVNKPAIELRNIADFSLIKRLPILMDADSIDIHHQRYYYAFRDIVIDPVRPYIYAFLCKTNHYTDDVPDRVWLKVYNYETMEEVKDLTPAEYKGGWADTDLYPGRDVRCLDVSDDGKYLAVLNEGEAYLKVWNLETMEQIINKQLYDGSLQNPDDYRCKAADIEFSSINSDVVYFSGYFPHQDEPVDSSGVLKFSITNKSVETIKTGYPFAILGKFILFDNEERVLVYSGSSLKFLNQLQQKLELSVGPTLEYPFYNKTIFTKKYGLFIGYDGEYIGSLKYDSQTGVGTNYEQEIIISPNPTTGFVNINLECTSSEVSYHINNSQGLLMFQDTTNNNRNLQIDFTSYPSGIYFLTINCANQIKTYKIIKES